MSRKRTLGAVGLLGLLAVQDVAAATGAAGQLLGAPDWVVYVGLAVLCPEDINEIVKERLGLGGGD